MENSNEKLNFFVSEVGVLSTLEDFKESDRLSMPGNTNNRIEKGNVVMLILFHLMILFQKSFKVNAHLTFLLILRGLNMKY